MATLSLHDSFVRSALAARFAQTRAHTMALAAPPLSVGSKRFTESYILGEILKQTAQSAGEASATHSQGLGNTAIVLNALTTGLRLQSGLISICRSVTRPSRGWAWA